MRGGSSEPPGGDDRRVIAAAAVGTFIEIYDLLVYGSFASILAELADWRPTEPFAFTKGLRTMRISTKGSWMNPWLHGSLLFDLETDPRPETPMVDDEVELRMVCLLVEQMRANDAPASQYERLGLPVEGEPGPEHLLVKIQRERAAETAEPLDRIRDLPGQDLIAAPILELLGDPAARAVLDRHVPEFAGSELLTLSREQSLVGLARHASVSWQTLHKLAVALSELVGAVGEFGLQRRSCTGDGEATPGRQFTNGVPLDGQSQRRPMRPHTGPLLAVAGEAVEGVTQLVPDRPLHGLMESDTIPVTMHPEGDADTDHASQDLTLRPMVDDRWDDSTTMWRKIPRPPVTLRTHDPSHRDAGPAWGA